MNKKIYISLPISGCEKEAREKAVLVKAKLSKQGWQPVSPFEIFAGKDATIGQHIGAVSSLQSLDVTRIMTGVEADATTHT